MASAVAADGVLRTPDERFKDVERLFPYTPRYVHVTAGLRLHVSLV